MKSYGLLTLLILFCFSVGIADDDVAKDKSKQKVVTKEGTLKPLKPFVSECCADIEMDIVPSTERKSGHMDQDYQKSHREVPRGENRLYEGKFETGYNMVRESPESKMRNSDPELHIFDVVPRYHQTRRIVEKDEGRVIERLPASTNSFVRNVKIIEDRKVPTTKRINGEGKYGKALVHQVPAVSNPLKEGSLDLGYNWVFAQKSLQQMMPEATIFFNNVPHESQMSNRKRVEMTLGIVPKLSKNLLDCR